MSARFLAALSARLDAGAREYGERSFDLSDEQIQTELEQEALDISGWAYVMWAKARRKAGMPADRELFYFAITNSIFTDNDEEDMAVELGIEGLDAWAQIQTIVGAYRE